MVMEIGGAKKRIGLAMSGGGFRAAAFHLGVMRKLQSARAARQGRPVELRQRWQHRGRLRRRQLEPDQTSSSVWTRTCARAPSPWLLSSEECSTRSKRASTSSPARTTATCSMARRSRISRRARGSTSTRPILRPATCSSSWLAAGLAAEMGEYELGVVPAPDFKVSHAVAASSAFPPVFPPLRLAVRCLRARGCGRVRDAHRRRRVRQHGRQSGRARARRARLRDRQRWRQAVRDRRTADGFRRDRPRRRASGS